MVDSSRPENVNDDEKQLCKLLRPLQEKFFTVQRSTYMSTTQRAKKSPTNPTLPLMDFADKTKVREQKI